MTRLLIDTDQVAEVTGLTDDSGATVGSATVKARILDMGDQVIQGSEVTLAAQGGGDYKAIIPSDLGLERDKPYQIEFTAESGNLKRTWRETHRARYGDW